jgi:hypothetical protein
MFANPFCTSSPLEFDHLLLFLFLGISPVSSSLQPALPHAHRQKAESPLQESDKFATAKHVDAARHCAQGELGWATLYRVFSRLKIGTFVAIRRENTDNWVFYI